MVETSYLDNEKHELALDYVDAVLVVGVERLHLRHAALLHQLPLQRGRRQLGLQLLERELQFPDVFAEHPDLEKRRQIRCQKGGVAGIG